jgi:glycosyltransferase involved in cell wall biosynthesis
MPQSPDLVLAGGAGANATALLALLSTPPFAGKARHLGYVSNEHRERLYRDASLLVMPSLDEGFGLPALEAMAMGVPVIAANRGALPEVVGDAGLVVDCTDAEGLAAAMHRMLAEPELAAACARRGLQQARRFSWQTSADRLIDAYRSAVQRRQARRA